MPETTYMHSLAHMATCAETTVANVQKILEEIGARPALVLNLTPYYDAKVLGTVMCRVKGWTDQPAYHKTYFPEIRSNG